MMSAMPVTEDGSGSPSALRPRRIRVVSGVAIRRDPARIRSARVYMGLRPPGSTRSGLWEFPGGKIEPGEGPQAALAREWAEEIGVSVSVGDRIATATLDLLDQIFQIDLFEVTTDRDLPTGVGRWHADLRWTNPSHALWTMPCSPGYYLHYTSLRNYLDRDWSTADRQESLPIRLVSAVLAWHHVSASELLLWRAPASSAFPSMWRFPARMVSGPGDVPTIAGLCGSLGDPDARVGERISTATLDLGDRIIRSDLFEVIPSSPEIFERALHASRRDPSHRWEVLPRAIRMLPCSPEMYLHYPHVASWLPRAVDDGIDG